MKKEIGIIKSGEFTTKVVQIERGVRHPLYNKLYKKTTNIKAHDEKNEYIVGDVVKIESVRPISRNKSWKISRKIKWYNNIQG